MDTGLYIVLTACVKLFRYNPVICKIKQNITYIIWRLILENAVVTTHITYFKSKSMKYAQSEFVFPIMFRTINVGPCHHGMARPRVADGGTASNMEGSYEWNE